MNDEHDQSPDGVNPIEDYVPSQRFVDKHRDFFEQIIAGDCEKDVIEVDFFGRMACAIQREYVGRLIALGRIPSAPLTKPSATLKFWSLDSVSDEVWNLDKREPDFTLNAVFSDQLGGYAMQLYINYEYLSGEWSNALENEILTTIRDQETKDAATFESARNSKL